MLKLSPAITVQGIPYAFGQTMDYTFFPDSEEKDIFYALAERPAYQAIDGKPAFNLTWYFGDNQDAGGICTLTAALPMPNMSDAKVQDAITAVLNSNESLVKIAQTTFALCQAIDAKNADEVAKLKASLGFDDAAVNRSKKSFDKSRDYKQFLPRISERSIKPVPFRSGKVTVQAFANENAYANKTPSYSTGSVQTTPSLMNSNAGVVTFNLQDLGANLFWHAFGGPKFDQSSRKPQEYVPDNGVSVVSVTYNVEFDGLLPEAKATVTLSKDVIAKLKVEDKAWRDSWGREHHEEVARGKEYTETVNSATEIVLPAIASKEDGDAVRKLLTDWAGKQLEDMAKSQLPDVKLDALNIDNVRTLETKSGQSRTYTLTQATTIPRNPQGQLQKISALAGKEPLTTFFQLIDLNEKPFFKVDVTVNPPNLGYLKARAIDRLAITDLSYLKTQLFGANGPVSTMTYKPRADTNVDDVKLKGTFDVRIPTEDRVLSYNYLVSYTDGTPSWQVKGLKLSGTNYLDLSGVDLGVLSVTLSGIDLPWDIVDSATVDVKYGDWHKKVALKQDASAFIAKPFGKPITGPLQYKVTLNPISGDPVEGEWIQVTPDRGNADISLQNPLGNMVRTLKFALVDGATAATLRVEYTFKSQDADRVFEQLIDLDSTATSRAPYKWRVPALSGHASSFRVVTAIVNDNEIVDPSGGDLAEVKTDPLIRVAPTKISKI